MTRNSYASLDTGRLIAEIVDTCHVADGDVLLALVHAPSTHQHVERVVRLDRAAWRDLDDYELSQFLAEQARMLPIPVRRGTGGPERFIVTIVARHGFAIIGAAEARWLLGWYWSNHLTDAFAGDMIVLTDNGWADFMSSRGGYEPRLHAAFQG